MSTASRATAAVAAVWPGEWSEKPVSTPKASAIVDIARRLRSASTGG